MRRSLVLLVAIIVAAAGCGVSGRDRPHQDVGAQAAALRTLFNADAGSVRILAVLSPTCGQCLYGAQRLQRDVLDEIDGGQIRTYIVWVPKKGAQERDVGEATRTVPDARATHYWDSDGYLVHTYPAVLGLDQDAWDVYLLYRPGVRWHGGKPPKPDLWMHQLNANTGQRYDSKVFATQLRQMLDSR